MIKSILSVGLNPSLPTTEVRKVKVLNQICTIGVAGSVLFLILDAILFPGDWEKILTLLAGVFMLTMCIWLQSIRQYIFARLLLIFLTMAIFYSHANHSFQGFYAEYFYLSIPMASLFFFDRSWIHYTFLVISISLFYIPNYFLEIYPEQYFGYSNVALMFISFFFFVRYFKVLNQKNEQALADQKELAVGLIQQKLLLSQLNPHFIFNALEVIQNDVLKNRPERAASSLTKFSKLMRQTLEHSREDFITLSDELESLHNYVAATKIGIRNEFEFSIILDGDIEQAQDMIPPMMIQPFLENAIEHGIAEKTNGEILLKVSKIDQTILVVLTDNGKGLIKSTDNRNYQSLSTSIIRERLQLLSQKYARLYTLKVDNRKNNEGVVVEIELPFQLV